MNQPVQFVDKTHFQGVYKRRGKKTYGLFLGLVLLLVAGFFIVTHIKHDRAIFRERMQYTAAESDLNSLADQVVTKFGKPDQRQSKQFCDQSTYCITALSLVYGVSSQDGAKGLAIQFGELLRGDREVRLTGVPAILPNLDSTADNIIKPQGFQLLGAPKLECKSNSIYTQIKNRAGTLILRQEYTLQLSCGERHPLTRYFE